MNEATFWGLIELLDWSLASEGVSTKDVTDETLDAVIEPAVAMLATFPIEDIEGFSELLAQKLFALDTEAHARNIGEFSYGPTAWAFSYDGFLHARCFAVACGRAAYERALRDPTQMPKDDALEGLLFLASLAHERKTGDLLDYSTSVSPETGSNQSGWNRPTEWPHLRYEAPGDP